MLLSSISTTFEIAQESKTSLVANFSNSGIRRNSDSKGKSCKYSTLHDEPNCMSHPTSTKNIKIQSHSLNKDRGISKKKVKTKENTISLLTLND